MKEIDARGLACPAPVLHTKAAVQEGAPDGVKIIVDNAASQQNVQRFLESKGFRTELGQADGDFFVAGMGGDSQSASPLPEAAAAPEAETRKIMVMCASDRMGAGDDVLGRNLMINFIKTLKEIRPELWRLVFVNAGVKLAIDGSEALPYLKEFEENGLKILVCGTCLTHFGLLERKQAGETTNMLDIVTAMQLSDKVINL
ncbi:MAG: sulfurtransferase-like selenium metabolism protein YedF [Desulfococcaceae bacterium]